MPNLSGLQRLIVALGFLLIGITGLYSPWVVDFEEDLGYEEAYLVPVAANRRFFIFGEKQPEQPWTEHGEYRYVGMMIDLSQLFVEWLSIGALTISSVLIVGLRGKSSPSRPG